jgi:hypothetical protein
MKKFAVLFLGMAMLSSTVGCYCNRSGCYTPNYLSPGYGGGGCPGGNCGVAPGGYPLGVAPQGMYQNYNSVQAGYPGVISAPVNAGAFAQPLGIPQTASAALEPLPTY